MGGFVIIKANVSISCIPDPKYFGIIQSVSRNKCCNCGKNHTFHKNKHIRESEEDDL